MSQYPNSDPRFMTPDQRDQAAAQAALNAARCETKPAPAEQPAAVEPDPTPPAKVPRPLSWAMRIAREKAAGEVSPDEHVAIAAHEHDQAVKAREQANERVINAEQSLAAAKLRATVANAETVRREAETRLRPLVTKAESLKEDLLALHRQYGGPARNGLDRSRGVLAEYAQSIASAISPVRRAKIASLYGQAGPLADRVANGYILCEQALKSFTIATTRGFGVDTADQELRAALACDAAKLRTEIEQLVSEVAAWKNPDAESWNVGGNAGEPGEQPEIGPWR